LHTEVPENQEGKGMATAIIEKVLLDIEYRGLRLWALCSMVAFYLKRHPDWYKITDEDNAS